MNAEIKARTLEALRSGKYRQSTHALAAADGFCCLGVICDLAVQDGLAKWIAYRYRKDCRVPVPPYDSRTEAPSNGLLPTFLLPWAGLTVTNPHVVYRGLSISLSECNDRRKFSFPTIADLIEANL